MKKQISKRTMDALKLLLDTYIKKYTHLDECPLCKLHYTFKRKYGGKPNDTCPSCPWELFGHKAEDSCACESWFRKNKKKTDENAIYYVRIHPERYEDLVNKRINMLKHWIRNCEVVK